MKLKLEYEEPMPYIVWVWFDNYTERLEMWQWSKKQFGNPLGPRFPDASWGYSDEPMLHYKFKNEADRTWFVLKWENNNEL